MPAQKHEADQRHLAEKNLGFSPQGQRDPRLDLRQSRPQEGGEGRQTAPGDPGRAARPGHGAARRRGDRRPARRGPHAVEPRGYLNSISAMRRRRSLLLLKARATFTAPPRPHPPRHAHEHGRASPKCYRAAGRLDLALPLYEQTLAMRKSKLGPDHPDTLAGMNNLGRGLPAPPAGSTWPCRSAEQVLALTKVEARSRPRRPRSRAWSSLAEAYRAVGQARPGPPALTSGRWRSQEVEARSRPIPTRSTSMGTASPSAYRAAGKLDLALPHFRTDIGAEEVEARPGPPRHPHPAWRASPRVYQAVGQARPGAAALRARRW